MLNLKEVSNMKIERISENQIRCTLNKADLADRDLRLSELAYGTDKAKSLFRDMMQQASYELGFEAEDIPLMIEAIPVNQDCLILVITKVEDPEELDTRFSKFSKPISVDMDEDTDETHQDESDEELNDEETSSEEPEQHHETILDLLNEIDQELQGLSSAEKLATSTTKDDAKSDSKAKKIPTTSKLYRVFTFKTLSQVIDASKVIDSMYSKKNTLYKNPNNDLYYLVVYQMDSALDAFSNVCTLLSEFSKREQGTYASTSYLEEHFKLMIKENAISVLANL